MKSLNKYNCLYFRILCGQLNRPAIFLLAVALIVFLFLALDGRLHWDEPFYLYTGTYQSLHDLVGEVEYERFGKEDWSTAVIFHLLVVRLITTLTGPGMFAMILVMIFYLALLFGFLYLNALILTELLGKVDHLRVTTILTMFTPVFVYFSFKTLPELPALFFGSLSTFTILRSTRTQPFIWITITALSLVATVLFKSTMSLIFISCIAAVLLFGNAPLKSAKLIINSVTAIILSLVIFYCLIYTMNIELSRYLASFFTVSSESESLLSVILHISIEGGLMFFALPLAWLCRRRKETLLMTSWFIFASVPLIIVTQSIEARYLAANIPALSGLILLSIEGLSPWIENLWRRHRLMTGLVITTVFAAISISSMFAQQIMSHEVEIDDFHHLLHRLDRIYGKDRYAILVPWEHTDYHYLRFLYPDRPVYNVYRGYESQQPSDPEFMRKRRAFESRFYGYRMVHTKDRLIGLENQLIYIGFKENFSVANLRRIFSWFQIKALDGKLRQLNLLCQITLSWMWNHPGINMIEIERVNHYVAFEVQVNE